jgi:hypothetical protein
MPGTRILQLLFASLVALMCVHTPGYAFDPARGARDSIIQSVRDDVRRQIRSREMREQRFRDSRAEFRSSRVEVRKTRIRKGTVSHRAP